MWVCVTMGVCTTMGVCVTMGVCTTMGVCVTMGVRPRHYRQARHCEQLPHDRGRDGRHVGEGELEALQQVHATVHADAELQRARRHARSQDVHELRGPVVEVAPHSRR
jgi:hypothetical protein